MRIPKLDVVYRSMTVPHFECWKASVPTVPAQFHDFAEEAGLSWSYGWASFPLFDRAWAEALDRVAPRGRTHFGGQVVFMNITEMTGQRIDAHLLGPNLDDCLHSSPPFVPGTWLRMFYHIVTKSDGQLPDLCGQRPRLGQSVRSRRLIARSRSRST